MIKRKQSGQDDKRMVRVERTAIRIWELLEQTGELSVDEIKEMVHSKSPEEIFDSAIQWLLGNEFAKAHKTPSGLKIKSN